MSEWTLLTLTVTDAVDWLPALSTARALIVRDPSATVVEFHETLYGAVASVATVLPPTRKST
jgi:hypothetical protein